MQEARAIQESIDKNMKLPKRFRINNVLVDVIYSLQTKLMKLDEQEAIELLEGHQQAEKDFSASNRVRI